MVAIAVARPFTYNRTRRAVLCGQAAILRAMQSRGAWSPIFNAVPSLPLRYAVFTPPTRSVWMPAVYKYQRLPANDPWFHLAPRRSVEIMAEQVRRWFATAPQPPITREADNPISYMLPPPSPTSIPAPRPAEPMLGPPTPKPMANPPSQEPPTWDHVAANRNDYRYGLNRRGERARIGRWSA
jgi:hypothetical protein